MSNLHFKKISLVLVCSASLFLNQNCGGGFESGDGFSKNHSPSDFNDFGVSYKAKMGDRTYISSVLASVFFPEGSHDPGNSELENVHESMHDYVSSDFTADDTRTFRIINDNILRNVDEFKGPCNAYDKDPHCNINNLNHARSQVDGIGSVSKEGIRVSVCYQILDRDRAVQNVINKVSRNHSTSRMSNEKIEDIFHLFYPGHSLDREASRSLASLADDTLDRTKSNLEAWRMVLLSICQTGAWQIP